MRRTRQWLSGLIVATSIASAPAWACSYHAGFSGGLSTSHPDSLTVAVAIANAREQGILSANQPSEDLGYRQALADLERFRKGLRITSQTEARTDFSLLLVSSGIWASFHVGQQGALARYHIAAPVAGRPVLITDESVLRAISSRRLSIDEAFELGIIRITGDEAESVIRLLTA
jgi:hypothetical protein